MDSDNGRGRTIKSSSEMKSLKSRPGRGYGKRRSMGHLPFNSLHNSGTNEKNESSADANDISRARPEALRPQDMAGNSNSSPPSSASASASSSPSQSKKKKRKLLTPTATVPTDILDPHIDPVPLIAGVKRSGASVADSSMNKKTKTNSSAINNSYIITEDIHDAHSAPQHANGSLLPVRKLSVARMQIGKYVRNNVTLVVESKLYHGRSKLTFGLENAPQPKRFLFDGDQVKSFKVCLTSKDLVLELIEPRSVPSSPNSPLTRQVFYSLGSQTSASSLDTFIQELDKYYTVVHISKDEIKASRELELLRSEREEKTATTIARNNMHDKDTSDQKDSTSSGENSMAHSSTSFYGSGSSTGERLQPLFPKKQLGFSVPDKSTSKQSHSTPTKLSDLPKSTRSLSSSSLKPTHMQIDVSDEERDVEGKEHGSPSDKITYSDSIASNRPRRSRAQVIEDKKKEEEEINELMIANREKNKQIFGQSKFTHTFAYDKKNIEITIEDFNRLNDYEFLNDTMINFFLKYAIDRLYLSDNTLGPKAAENVYLFNTYFYARLSEGKAGYENVKRWTSKVDIFKYKYIVVPIHAKMHWYVAIIYNLPKLLENQAKRDQEARENDFEIEMEVGQQNRSEDAKPSADTNGSEAEEAKTAGLGGEEVEYDDEEDDIRLVQAANTVQTTGRTTRNSSLFGGGATFSPSSPKSKVRRGVKQLPSKFRPTRPQDPEDATCIFVLDSLRTGTGHGATQKVLKDYILSEAKERKNVDIDRDIIFGYNPICPQQQNYCDCGVYIVHYAEIFLKNPEKFSWLAIAGRAGKKGDDNVKEEIKEMWCESQLANKRQNLRQLLLSVKEEDSKKASSASASREQSQQPEESSSGGDSATSKLDKLALNGSSSSTPRESPTKASPRELSASSGDQANCNTENENENEKKEQERGADGEGVGDKEEEDIMVVESKQVEKRPSYRKLTNDRNKRS